MNRPLLLFVGGHISKEQAVKQYGDLGVVCFDSIGHYYGGSLVVGRPDRKGEIDEVVVLSFATATPDDVKAWLMSAPKPVPTPMPRRGPGDGPTPPPPPPTPGPLQFFAPAPQFFAPVPRMMFRGGFGGGMRCGPGG